MVNADDFGLAPEVNEAIEAAHVNGILTSASLMVAGPAAKDALARARSHRDLRLGLHLVLVGERPLLPRSQIPHLVARDGNLRKDMARLGWEIAASPRVRAELRAEIEAQFDAFHSTGLRLDHVNAHKHFHLHPIVASMIAEIGPAYGMRAMRVPDERGSLLKSAAVPGNTAHGIAVTACVPLLRNVVRRAQLIAPDHVLGLRWSGAMHADRLRALLTHLPEGLVEIYMHPATANVFAGSTDGYQYRAEFAALTDPGCIEAVRSCGYHMGGYLDSAEDAARREARETI